MYHSCRDVSQSGVPGSIESGRAALAYAGNPPTSPILLFEVTSKPVLLVACKLLTGRTKVTPAFEMLLVSVATGALHVVVGLSQPSCSAPAGRGTAVGMYLRGTLGLFLTYGWMLRTCRRAPVSTVSLCVLLGSPVVFQLFWLFTPPVLSIDLYSYLVDSHSASMGLNPYLHAPRDMGGLPFGIELSGLAGGPRTALPVRATLDFDHGCAGADRCKPSCRDDCEQID